MTDLQKILDFLALHWAELLAAIGAGGAGHFGSKALTDKTQDSKIKKNFEAIQQFEKRFNEMDKLIVHVQNELAMNSQSDINNRQRMEDILADLKEGQRQMHNLLMEIVTGKIKLK